jgi:hypothetical protein
VRGRQLEQAQELDPIQPLEPIDPDQRSADELDQQELGSHSDFASNHPNNCFREMIDVENVVQIVGLPRANYHFQGQTVVKSSDSHNICPISCHVDKVPKEKYQKLNQHLRVCELYR